MSALTEEERVVVERTRSRWNDESEVGQLRAIIDRLTAPLPRVGRTQSSETTR